MHIRIVDYVANSGGGHRFAGEVIKALRANDPGLKLEVISHGTALEQYRALCNSCSVELYDVAPKGEVPRRLGHIRGVSGVLHRLGVNASWYFSVSDIVFQGADVVWFPWMHRHRLPLGRTPRVVASFHDALFFEFPNLLPRPALKFERRNTREWLDSPAHVVTSSRTTVRQLEREFPVAATRFTIVPVSGDHVRPATAVLPDGWRWGNEPFLVYPANIFPHKNHENLFRGVGLWGAKRPLVLTGAGSDLRGPGRAAKLRDLAKRCGLEIGQSLLPVGYVADELYYSLIGRAWALVMPTLGEGGGSFPVYEAMQSGIPVLCSDIAVLREQIERTGGDVLWFDPLRPEDLLSKLQELERHYSYYKFRANRDSDLISRRTWRDVAREYRVIFEKVASAAAS